MKITGLETFITGNQPPHQGGRYFIFVKLDQAQYGLSDDFSLNRRRNELTGVLRILKQLKKTL